MEPNMGKRLCIMLSISFILSFLLCTAVRYFADSAVKRSPVTNASLQYELENKTKSPVTIHPTSRHFLETNVVMSGLYKEPPEMFYVPKRRLLHLDLKGAPPKVSFLKEVMNISKEVGATGLLLEWEDMFPWHGPLSRLAAPNAYSRDEVRELLGAAQKDGLEVIPLIQTFGHLELVLKHDTFKHLREVSSSAQSLCPSLEASSDLIELMIEQIMELHPNSSYLHIGCDEVFQMAECIKCRHRSDDEIFLSHIVRVASIVRAKHPKVTPIIWDDMLRSVDVDSMRKFYIGELVQPMVWEYSEHITRMLPSNLWETYSTIFPRVWTASAFKGAFGKALYIPNVMRHLENNLDWLKVMRSQEPNFKYPFQGIAITGWQRYDHFSQLCELLPAAIPSMTISLLVMSHGFMNENLLNKANTILKCGALGHAVVHADPFLWSTFSNCSFPGYSFFNFTRRLSTVENATIDFIRLHIFWVYRKQARNNETISDNLWRLEQLLQDLPQLYSNITPLAKAAEDALLDVFDSATIVEWVDQNIKSLVDKLDKLQKDAVAVITKSIDT